MLCSGGDMLPQVRMDIKFCVVEAVGGGLVDRHPVLCTGSRLWWTGR